MKSTKDGKETCDVSLNFICFGGVQDPDLERAVNSDKKDNRRLCDCVSTKDDVFHDEDGEALDLEIQKDAPVQLDFDLDLNGRRNQQQEAKGTQEKYWKEVPVADMKAWLCVTSGWRARTTLTASLKLTVFRNQGLADLMGKSRWLQHFVPGTCISIDEAMIANGRLYFKQYMKGKPTPWGIKVWCAADPTNRYVLDVDVYTGNP
ncbi:hypothetical protein RRG08_040344 [Elysia crispata]|uniref:PiggyBac transposable element-derived protein domain-containing protein n=1 Tax=Elysia crispata TaxID=231223 RepID=A0AAE1E3R8_9GAST|nr:hypothetical protein RRG08_040344 [Elysia crispata]